MRRFALLLTAALFIPLAAKAVPVSGGGGCRVTLFSASSASAVYDPFDDSFSPVPITISLQTTGCSGARIQFALAPTPTTPQTGVQVDLTSSGNILLASVEDSGGQTQAVSNPATAFQSSPPFFPLSTAGALTNSSPLEFDVAPGQPVPPNTYIGDLSLLARVTDGNGAVSQVYSTPLDLSVSVNPSVRLAAGSGDLLIDLGEIHPGEVGGPINFSAYANVNYELRLISDNGFTIVPGGHGGPVGGIPYATFVSGQATPDSGVGQDGRATRELDFGVPGGSGVRSHTFEVKVGPFTNMPAAPDYSDVVTLEIRARV